MFNIKKFKLPVFKFQIFNFISNTDHAHTHLRIISLVLVQPQACKVPSIHTSVSQHSLNCIYMISCLQHMTTWHAQQRAVCHREQHCLSLWCHQSPECRSMVLLCAYSSKTQHKSSTAKMMVVFVVFTPCFRRTYCLHLKGEGWVEVTRCKKTCQFEGICPNTATEGVHRNVLPPSSEWLNWFWYMLSDGVEEVYQLYQNNWGNLAVHSCHPITSGPTRQNSVNLQTQATYYSEMLEQTEHTTWYENTKDYHHLNS